MNQYETNDGVKLSEYEKIRLANISRNNDRLISLGLISLPVSNKIKSEYSVKRKKKSVSTLPTRTKLGRTVKDKAKMLRFAPDKMIETMRSTRIKAAADKRTAAKPVEKMDVTSGLILHSYKSGSAAAEDVKGHQSAISNACNHRIKTYKGYCWQFVGSTRGKNNKIIKIGKTRLCKQFINKKLSRLEWFKGIVSCKCGRFYRVTYDDGDSEDMTRKEVITYMK